MKKKLMKIYKAPRAKRGQVPLPQITARADEAFGSKNYAEFSVEKKKEGAYLAYRVLLILLYVLTTLGYIVFCSTIKFFLWFLVIIPVFVMVIIHFTWWIVSVEYKYTVDKAVFAVKTIYGNRYERLLFEEKIKDITLVAPYKGTYKKEADSICASASEISYAVSSKMTDDIYFAVCGDKIVFFEMTSQALVAFKYYNSSVTVSASLSR